MRVIIAVLDRNTNVRGGLSDIFHVTKLVEEDGTDRTNLIDHEHQFGTIAELEAALSASLREGVEIRES